MVRQHHQLNGHEFEQTLGKSEGQRSLAGCSPWSCEESVHGDAKSWTRLSMHTKKRIKSEKELFETFERKMIQIFLVRMRNIR